MFDGEQPFGGETVMAPSILAPCFSGPMFLCSLCKLEFRYIFAETYTVPDALGKPDMQSVFQSNGRAECST